MPIHHKEGICVKKIVNHHFNIIKTTRERKKKEMHFMPQCVFIRRFIDAYVFMECIYKRKNVR